MAATIGRLMGAQGNSFSRKKNGEKKNLVGRRNVTVMVSVAFPGMKEEYETLKLSPGATEKDVKSHEFAYGVFSQLFGRVDIHGMQFSPTPTSFIAASTVFLSRLTLDFLTHPWNPTLAHYTGYKVSQLKDCLMAIYNVQMNRKASTLVAIREKYQQHMFKCVASLPPPPFIAERFFEDTPN